MTEQSKKDLISVINDALTGKCISMGKNCIKKDDVAIWIADEFERRKLYFNISPMESTLYSADTTIGIKVINPMPVPATDPNQLNLIDQIKEVEGMDFDRDDARKTKITIKVMPDIKLILTYGEEHSNEEGWIDFKPTYGSDDASCFDLRADIKSMKKELLSHDGILYLQPGERIIVPLGLKSEIPIGWEVVLRARSGMAAKQGLMMANGVGTIDADFRNVWGTILYNSDKLNSIAIKHGDRICQGKQQKTDRSNFVIVTEGLSGSVRGEGGYGSTGKR